MATGAGRMAEVQPRVCIQRSNKRLGCSSHTSRSSVSGEGTGQRKLDDGEQHVSPITLPFRGVAAVEPRRGADGGAVPLRAQDGNREGRIVTLAEWDNHMKMVGLLEAESRTTAREALTLELATIDAAGIKHTPRQPGFPCWSHDSLPGYYSTPRQVLEALERGAP